MPKKKVKAPAVAKSRRCIAIMGTTPTRMQGPIDDKSGWEIWTIGPGGKDVHRWDRLFELHGTWPWEFGEYLGELSVEKPPKKVFSLAPMPDMIEAWRLKHEKSHKDVKAAIKGTFPANVIYPRAKMFELFRRRMWFSSSIGYCAALAIAEGATDIGFWGIDLESGEEYISQFTGGAFFIDVAQMFGINVHGPKGCGLFRDPNPYPDRNETLLAETYEKKKNWLRHTIEQTQGQFDSAKAEVHRQEGRCLIIRQLVGQGKVKQEELNEAERILLQNNIHLGNLGANLNRLQGELGATEYYQRMFIWNQNDPNIIQSVLEKEYTMMYEASQRNFVPDVAAA